MGPVGDFLNLIRIPIKQPVFHGKCPAGFFGPWRGRDEVS